MAKSISVATARKALKSISKSRGLFIFKAVVAVAVMATLIKFVRPQEIYKAILQANKLWVMSAFLLVGPNLYIQYRKWRFLVSLIKPTVNRQEAWRSLLVGFTFGFVTPGRVGEFGRAFFIKDCPWARVLGVTMLDKLFSISIIAIMGSIGLLLIWNEQTSPATMWLRATIVILIIGLLCLVLASPDKISSLLHKSKLSQTSHPKLKLFMSSLDEFHRKQAVVLWGWCVLFFFTFTVQLYLLVVAFELVPPLRAFAASSAAMFVKTLLPISLGDIGIRESVAVYFFGRVGVSRAAAFDASFILFSINVLIPSILGLFVLLRDRINGIKNIN